MKPLILLIEDDPQIRRFLRASLGVQGYELIEAETGREGLALAASRVPDLVILDLGLPDLEGIEVIRHLREWSSCRLLFSRPEARNGIRWRTWMPGRTIT